MNTKPVSITITRTHEITSERIASLLCCGIEGGIGYWACIVGYGLLNNVSFDDFNKGGKFQFPDNYYHPYELIPLFEGCTLFVEDMEERTVFRLNRKAIKRGLKTMADQYPKDFDNFLDENTDVETGDVFIQCCLLGKIVYG